MQPHHAVTRHPALIITDLHMPKMDGLELLRTVQVSLPDIPTIIVTGTDEGIRSKADAAQMVFGYLRKPVDVTCLKGLVKAAIATGSLPPAHAAGRVAETPPHPRRTVEPSVASPRDPASAKSTTTERGCAR